MNIGREELEKAVRLYSDIMFRCAYAYCPNKEDSQDIVQEVFVKYLKKQPSFNDEEHRKAWLLRVTINLAKDYAGSFSRRHRGELHEWQGVASDDTKSCEIWDMVQSLPAKYRIVIELYYHEGMTIEEISQAVGAARSTIGDRLAKARELLKKMYGEE